MTSKNTKERVLVTGGTGFQGSHMVEYLARQGYNVSILNTPTENAQRNLSKISARPEIVWGSITDPELVRKTVQAQDIVVHTAARTHVGESLQDPLSHVTVNILGTTNVLEAIRTSGRRIRLIHWSTCEVYGEPTDGSLNEKSEFRPKSPYAASKAGADRLVYAYAKSFGIDATIVRPFNIFGERQKANSSGAVIPIFVEKALNEQNLTIHGNGEQTRDFMYISDLIQAFALVLDHPELSSQAINFATGVNTPVRDIATYIAKRLNVEVEFGPARPGEVQQFPADITKALSLGFNPRVSIFEGIDRYIAWKTKS